MNSQLLHRLHLHHSDMDYEKFYENFVPKSHLPSDYGGDLESLEELHKKSCKKITGLKDYFLFEEQQAKLEFDPLVDEHFEELNKN